MATKLTTWTWRVSSSQIVLLGQPPKTSLSFSWLLSWLAVHGTCWRWWQRRLGPLRAWWTGSSTLARGAAACGPSWRARQRSNPGRDHRKDIGDIGNGDPQEAIAGRQSNACCAAPGKRGGKNSTGVMIIVLAIPEWQQLAYRRWSTRPARGAPCLPKPSTPETKLEIFLCQRLHWQMLQRFLWVFYI